MERGRCQKHQRERDRERGTSAQRGYGAQHRRWRQAVLGRDRVCRICKAAPATVADHIVPLSAGGESALANGQGLCRSCHSRKTVTEGAFGATA